MKTLTSLPALGIGLEEYEYPYPVHFFSVNSDLQSLKKFPTGSSLSFCRSSTVNRRPKTACLQTKVEH